MNIMDKIKVLELKPIFKKFKDENNKFVQVKE